MTSLCSLFSEWWSFNYNTTRGRISSGPNQVKNAANGQIAWWTKRRWSWKIGKTIWKREREGETTRPSTINDSWLPPPTPPPPLQGFAIGGTILPYPPSHSSKFLHFWRIRLMLPIKSTNYYSFMSICNDNEILTWRNLVPLFCGLRKTKIKISK